MSIVNKNNKNGNSLLIKIKTKRFISTEVVLTLWCLMPQGAISTELVRLMANVGFVLEGFKDKKYNDRNDRNKCEAPVSRVLAYRIGASKILRKKYSYFQ